MAKQTFKEKTKKEKIILITGWSILFVALLADTIYLYVTENWKDGTLSLINELFLVISLLILFFYIKKRGWKNFNIYWKRFVFIFYLLSVSGFWINYLFATLLFSNDNEKLERLLINSIVQTVVLTLIYGFFLFALARFKKLRNI